MPNQTDLNDLLASIQDLISVTGAVHSTTRALNPNNLYDLGAVAEIEKAALTEMVMTFLADIEVTMRSPRRAAGTKGREPMYAIGNFIPQRAFDNVTGDGFKYFSGTYDGWKLSFRNYQKKYHVVFNISHPELFTMELNFHGYKEMNGWTKKMLGPNSSLERYGKMSDIKQHLQALPMILKLAQK